MDEGVLDLPDGRKLAYTEWGPPDAPAVLYCHGFPTNRRELELIGPVLERCGVEARVVALNRPGYGLSTFQRARTFLDWPQDVADAADRLGIGGFAVLGVSGGCPYALACGHTLPDRVTRIGIVVGVAPIEATGMENAASIAGPSASGLDRRLQFGMMAYGLEKGQVDRILDRTFSTMSEVDRSAFEQPDLREWFLEVTRESLQQGGRTAAHEAGLLRKPWGFDPQRVAVQSWLWYGGADETVPSSAGRWLADRLPNCEYVLWPEHGHISWMIGEEAASVVAVTAGQEEST